MRTPSSEKLWISRLSYVLSLSSGFSVTRLPSGQGAKSKFTFISPGKWRTQFEYVTAKIQRFAIQSFSVCLSLLKFRDFPSYL